MRAHFFCLEFSFSLVFGRPLEWSVAIVPGRITRQRSAALISERPLHAAGRSFASFDRRRPWRHRQPCYDKRPNYLFLWLYIVSPLRTLPIHFVIIIRIIIIIIRTTVIGAVSEGGGQGGANKFIRTILWFCCGSQWNYLYHPYWYITRHEFPREDDKRRPISIPITY